MIKNIKVEIGAIWFDEDTKTLQVVAKFPYNDFGGWSRYVCQLVYDDGYYHLPYHMEQAAADCDNYIDDCNEDCWNDSDIDVFNGVIHAAMEIIDEGNGEYECSISESVYWADDEDAEKKIV